VYAAGSADGAGIAQKNARDHRALHTRRSNGAYIKQSLQYLSRAYIQPRSKDSHATGRHSEEQERGTYELHDRSLVSKPRMAQIGCV